MDTKNSSTSRRGGQRKKKNADVRLVITSLYVGDKPMAQTIGNAVVDSFRRKTEEENETA